MPAAEVRTVEHRRRGRNDTARGYISWSRRRAGVAEGTRRRHRDAGHARREEELDIVAVRYEPLATAEKRRRSVPTDSGAS